MASKQTKRRYVYQETEKEIVEWAERMIREHRIIRPPNYIANFPYYLQEFVKYHKKEAV